MRGWCLQVVLAPLPNGNVLTAGGAVMDSSGANQAAIAEAEVFNVKTHQWATVSPMGSARTLHQVLNATRRSRGFRVCSCHLRATTR